MQLKAVAFAAAAGAAVAINNGKGVTPPMGWRSWSEWACAVAGGVGGDRGARFPPGAVPLTAPKRPTRPYPAPADLFGANVNQGLIMSQMSAIANRSRMVNGAPTSLCDLGYCDVGLDDNWQECGKWGPNGYSFHDANGRPIVNQARFPDFIAMTSYAHSLGLTSGWYGNNCICSDHCTDPSCYQGDVDAVMDYGFDSIKLDGCGGQRDLDLYASLFNATGKSILIENCHWGGTVPNATWCPWNYFRSSGDIRASYDAVVGNLQTTIQWAQQGLSQPGCWAYPDMRRYTNTLFFSARENEAVGLTPPLFSP